MAASPAAGGTDIGRRIGEQRKRAGLSRDDAAQRAGLAPEYLAYLESSKEPNPAQATLIRLAAALGTSVGALSGAGQTMPPGQRGTAVHPVLTDLTPAQCAQLIAPGGVGRVLFIEEGRGPVAIPVNFRMDGADVVFRTGDGPLSAAAGSQSVLSFDVDHIDDALSEGWSVLLTGTASVITDPEELRRAASLGIEPWAGGDRPAYVRLRPHRVTGRAIRVAAQAHEGA